LLEGGGRQQLKRMRKWGGGRHAVRRASQIDLVVRPDQERRPPFGILKTEKGNRIY